MMMQNIVQLLQKQLYILLFIFITTGLSMTAAQAENTRKALYIEEQTTGSMQGRPFDFTKKSYYAGDYVYINDGSQPYRVLCDLKKKKVYLINAHAKQYTELTLSRFVELSRQGTGNLSDSQMQVRETGEKKEVAGYNCVQVVMMIPPMGIKTTMWVPEKIDVPMKQYFSFADRTGLGGQVQGINPILKKYKSYPVQSRTVPVGAVGVGNIINVKVQKIEYTDVDSGIFSVPAGYTEVQMQSE